MLESGSERGVQVLDALELGSSWTLDLHLDLLRAPNRMFDDFQIAEFVIIGTQADPAWFTMPVRYGHEDGSDGVIRVSGSNLNFNYLKFSPNSAARSVDWSEASKQADKHLDRSGDRTAYYEIIEASTPDNPERNTIPLAIPYACAHTGEDMGIVMGEGNDSPAQQVMELLQAALDSTPATYKQVAKEFERQTQLTYDKAKTAQAPGWLKKLFVDPREQYDHHAQVIFRLRDQHGRPVEHFDIFFDSEHSVRKGALAINALFEDNHRNDLTSNVITFYLRTNAWDDTANDWVDRVPEVDSCYLEVSAIEPGTDDILYLPLRYTIPPKLLQVWLRGHQTTIIDIELCRLPSGQVFQLKRR